MDINMVLADNIVKFLKSRMMLTQQFLSTGVDIVTGDPIPTISFDDYVDTYSLLYNTAVAVRDARAGVCNRVEDIHKAIIHKRNLFASNYYKYVVMTEEQIDELMSYVRKSIELLGLGEKWCYYPSSIIKESIKRLLKYMEETNISEIDYNRVVKWNMFFKSYHVIETRTMNTESIYYRPKEDTILTICNLDSNKICEIDKDGNIIFEAEEDLLIAENIYIGYEHIHINDNEVMKNPVCYLLCVKDGKKMMKQINDSGIYLPLEPLDKNEDYFEPLGTIIELFNENGCNALNKHLYNRHEFENQVRVKFNNYMSLTDEEKDKLEDIIKIIVDWYVNYIFEINNNSLETDKIDKFRIYFTDELRMYLLYYYKYNNTCTIDACTINSPLYNALRKSQLQIDYYLKATMRLSDKKIYLKSDYIDEETILCDFENSKKKILEEW